MPILAKTNGAATCAGAWVTFGGCPTSWVAAGVVDLGWATRGEATHVAPFAAAPCRVTAGLTTPSTCCGLSSLGVGAPAPFTT